eukprot:TRINITY_DN1900_c0_g2_i1.p1 TRINITY_DN1900_c0_g2~~TRINITY_DN1900_c0_g2_i1.p1  ORF type:complete len:121 (+),score=21.74 TRINITY_DN1900_c0_g2_i1:34-396(+)
MSSTEDLSEVKILLSHIIHPSLKGGSMVPYTYRAYAFDDVPGAGLLTLVSLLAGIAGLIARSSLCSWLAFFSILSSVVDTRQSERDMKLICICSTLAVMGLVIDYLLAWPEFVWWPLVVL